ncbi:MAG: histidine kinase, partial [Anaerolineales bacterium]
MASRSRLQIEQRWLLAIWVVLASAALLGLLGILNVAALGVVVLVSISLGAGLTLRQPASADDQDDWLDPDAVAIDAAELRLARERERAFYDMTSTLSSTLDYQKVLDAVQNVGELVTRHQSQGAEIISAALLFQGGKQSLQVASARGLTRQDMTVEPAGRAGVLGIALRQTEPVFGAVPAEDPELKYFAAFQSCQSLVVVPLQAGFEYYGVLVFGSKAPGVFSEIYSDFLKVIGTQATIALQNAVLYQDILDEKERIVEVEEDARKKLARDLHDGPTQSVATIAMRANFIRRLIERQPQQALEELWKVEDIARRTTKEIRHMLFTMRPLVLENKGLVAALNQLAEKMKDTHNTIVLVQAVSDVESYLDTNAQGVLFYSVDEAVNNARKHAA